MRTFFPRWVGVRAPGLLALSCLGALLACPPARADVLRRFTGYTRPGSPSDGPGAARPAAAERDKTPIGATVYYMVLDRTEGVKGDTWGTGDATFDSSFI